MRFLRRLAPVLPLALFGVALWVLHHELARFHVQQVVASLRSLPASRLLLGGLLTVCGYAVLTGYDLLGTRYAGAPIPYPRIAFTSFIGYAFSNAVGHALLTSTPLRFRLYSAWGATAEQIARVVTFCFVTFWIGFLSLTGVVFTLAPSELPPALRLPAAGERPFGVLCLLLVGGYLLASALRRRPFRLRSFEMALPTPPFAAAQVVVGAADWALAAAVLWAFLPAAGGLTFHGFLGAFLLAQMLGLLSQVPGGLGVFETALVLVLGPVVPHPALLGALVLYRLVYYLAPLLAAALMLAAVELHRQRRRLGVAVGAVGRLVPTLAPQALAAVAFLAGSLLLLTGALPLAAGGLPRLHALLPLPLIEASHLLGSVAGAALLVLARGLQRRLDAAWHATVVLLAGGVALALLRGAGGLTALVLALMLAAVAPLRGSFDRRASLAEARFTPGWSLAVAVVLAATVWLTAFAHRHVVYSHELWWSFALDGDAPRALRALVGAATLLLVVAAARLLRPAPRVPGDPSADDLERAAAIARAAPATYAWLSQLGDKRLLFDDAGSAFVMFGVEGRSWVAMGDPVGPRAAGRELAWRLRDLAARRGGWAVFYEVGEETLPDYVELGLSLLKLGEEARVPLAGFGLAGGERKDLRHTLHKLEADGASFELVPAAAVDGLLPRLAVISEAWLGGKQGAEKGFSLGTFQPAYLRRFPLALVRQGEEIVAFANVLASGDRAELAPDLMRYLPTAPPGVMTYLFTHLMLWGAAQGYGCCNLGMAPLAGLDARSGASWWNRLAGLLYRHGEHFYNFQGLRLYKEKFHPEWTPRYLASPGGFALPQVVANLTTLVAGGVREVLRR